jgi:Glycosyl transferase family 2
MRKALVVDTHTPTPKQIARELAIVAVLVVYERQLDVVEGWPALLAALLNPAGDTVRLQQVVIYDNSPEPCAKPAADISGCTYVHDRENGGTAAAYMLAAATARDSGVDWLLLLDQDTRLSPDYLAALALVLATSSGPTPGALVPWVVHEDTPISPARITWSGTIAPLRHDSQLRGLPGLTAIASGSLLHVPSFLELLPLPKGLWLDYVDHWVFRCLQKRSHVVTIVDQVLQHDLSIANLRHMSRRRLLSILEGEAQFQRLLGGGARILYPFRIAARVIRYFYIRPRLAIYTLAWAWQRVG